MALPRCVLPDFMAGFNRQVAKSKFRQSSIATVPIVRPFTIPLIVEVGRIVADVGRIGRIGFRTPTYADLLIRPVVVASKITA